MLQRKIAEGKECSIFNEVDMSKMNVFYFRCVTDCKYSSLDWFQDDETKAAESADGESAPAVMKETEQNAPSAEKPTTPAKDSKEKEGRKGILNAIRIPLVSSVFSRRKKVSISDAEKDISS